MSDLTQKNELFVQHYLAEQCKPQAVCDELAKTGKHTTDIVDWSTFTLVEIEDVFHAHSDRIELTQIEHPLFHVEPHYNKRPKKTLPLRSDGHVPGSPEAIAAMSQAYEQSTGFWDTADKTKVDINEDWFPGSGTTKNKAQQAEIADVISLEFEILDEEEKIANNETVALFSKIED
jgi:hypothetical protein